MIQPLATQSPSQKSTSRSLFLVKETIEYADQVEKLIDTTFAADIQSRPVYRYRQHSARIEPLCKIALDPKGKVQGCIRFFKCGLVKGDGTMSDAILLGPLSVSTANRGRGLAHQLIQHSLAEARARRLGPCFVVGDPKIYRKHGFCNATSLNITLEGQDDLRRFLVAELDIGQFSQQMRDSALVPLS